MLSPEQSMNCRARMVCHVWLVSCHALMPTIAVAVHLGVGAGAIEKRLQARLEATLP